MEDNLRLGVEFPIDEERLKREMALAKKEISGAGQTAEQVAEKATAGMNRLVAEQTTGSKKLAQNLQGLKIQLQSYQAIVEKSFDPAVIEEYNKKIAETARQISSISGIGTVGGGAMGGSSVMRQARQFDGMHFSMQQIMREMPAFTYSMQTGFMAIANNIPILTDEIGRARKENEALTASGQKGVPIWKRLVGSLLSWQSAMVIGITVLTVYGKEIGEWLKGLFQTRKAIDATKASQDALNESLEGSEVQNAIKNIEELRIAVDLARKGTISKKDAVDRYNETLGKTVGEANDLATVEKFLVDNADAYIRMTLYKAAANLQLAEAAKRAAEIQANAAKEAEEFANTADDFGAVVKTGGAARLWNWMTGSNNTYYEDEMEEAGERRRKSVENQLKKEQEAYTKNANELMAKAAEYANQMQIALFGGSGDSGDKGGASILNERRQLLDKLAAIDAEYARKSFTKDEEELQALRDKFTAIRREVERFNADSKNKGVRIDIAGLVDVEDRAVADLTYRQGTRKLAEELDQQGKIWAAYEEFKTATSKEHADDRFADELDKINAFRGELEKQVSELTMKSITAGLTGGEEERLKALDGLLRGVEDKEQADRDKRFKKAFADSATFEQKRTKIIADAEADISALTKQGELDRADERRKARDKDLLDLSKAEIEGSKAYKKMTDTLSTAGSAMAVQALKQGKEAVISLVKGMKGRTDAEKAALIKMFEDWFGTAIAEATDENFANVTSLVDGFGQLVESALRFDGTLSTSLKTIGSMVSQVGKLSDTLGKTLQEVGGSLSKGGGYASIIGGLLSAFGTIVSISEARTEKQLQKIEEANELQIKGLNATTKLLERQLSIVEDIYGTKRIEAYRRAVVDTEKEINDGLTDIGDSTFALFTGSGLTRSGVSRFNNEFNGSLDELDAAIREAEKKSKNFWNIIWGSSSTHSREADALRSIREAVLNGDTWQAGWNTVADITQEGINKLYEIIDSGTLDDVTAAKVQNIIDQYELWREATNALNEELTGTTFGTITDEIVQMFRTGTVAAEDFAESFEKLMQEALLNSFKRKYLEEGLQEWYDEFAKAVESDNPDGTKGLHEDEIAALRDGYGKIIDDARKGFEALEDIAKMPLTDPSSSGSTSGISGRINRTIEESTASEILGFERARYDLHKRTLVNAEETLRVDKQLYDATLQSIRHQAAIEQNTADTVTELRTAVVELKAINKNTKQTSTSYDRP